MFGDAGYTIRARGVPKEMRAEEAYRVLFWHSRFQDKAAKEALVRAIATSSDSIVTVLGLTEESVVKPPVLH